MVTIPILPVGLGLVLMFVFISIVLKNFKTSRVFRLGPLGLTPLHKKINQLFKLIPSVQKIKRYV